MFSQLDMAPPDAILGLTEAFKQDPRADKINLGVGIYKDAQGNTPVLQCVKQAERQLLDREKTKSYLAIPGAPEYGAQVRQLLFGRGHEILNNHRARTAHTPGGTGALRVAADFLRQKAQLRRVWLSAPTWENHAKIFEAAGIATQTYPYYNFDAKSLDFEPLCAALQEAGPQDAVLFHASCHNPSGMDPDPQQWQQLAALARERGFLPLFDFAYQGFAEGLDEDAAGLRAFCVPGAELLVCSSFSKNFGLYNERVGALTLVAADNDAAERAFSHLKTCIRTNYSNPPAHGGLIVQTILQDTTLHATWEKELTDMRNRINTMRRRLVEALAEHGVAQDFSFIARQRGMFSFSGLSPQQVQRLRDEFAIYIVASGRINVAGITESNLAPLCKAIKAVL